MFHDELPSLDHVDQLNQDPALLSVLPYGQFPKATSLGAWLRRSGQNSTDFRSGNCSPAKDNLAFIKQCQEARPAGVQVRQDGDSSMHQHP